MWVRPLKETEGLFVNQLGGLGPRVWACMQNRCGRIGPKLCRTGGHSSQARGAEGRAGQSQDEEEGGWRRCCSAAPTFLFHVSTKFSIKSSNHYISSTNGQTSEML